MNYIVLYLLDLILTLKIYDDIRDLSVDFINKILEEETIKYRRKVAEDENKILKFVNTSNMIILERIQQPFIFEACGMFQINGELLAAVNFKFIIKIFSLNSCLLVYR